MSASTAFSYAQAAKGQVISQPAAPLSGSTAPSTKDDGLSSTASGTAPPSQAATSEMSESVKSLHTESEIGRQNTDLDVASVGESASSSGLATDQSIITPRADDAVETDSQRLPGEKFTRTSTQSSRSGDGADGKKGRKSKKGRNPEKDAEAEQAQEKEKEEIKIALVEASIPSVNIWAQRAASLATKKPASTTSANPAPVADSNTPEDSRTQEPKKKATYTETSEAQNGAASAGSKPPRRSGDATRFGNDSTTRRAPRGSRVFDSEKLNLPPVGDATSWPTPVSAADDEGKRTVPEKERAEAQVQEEAPSKSEKKKWVVMPFVPTVSFNTQIQQPRRPTREGGRPNGSTSRRGGQGPSANAAGDKPTAGTGSPGESTEATRDTAPPSRTNSLPPQASKRASMDVTYVRDQRKPSGPTSGPRPNGAEYPASATPIENVKSQRNEPGQGSAEQYPRRQEQSFRSGELGKEGNFSASKEQRPNRGGYRQPRGGSHNNAQGHPQQPGYPQGGQGFQRFGGPLSPPPNQTSFPPNYGAPPSKNGRPRPQSIPNGYMGKVSQNGAEGAPKMHQLQTSGMDYNGYPMGPYSAHLQYPQPYYDPSVVHVLMIQVEYYLSVENLCKDMFLRKKMDSQGFVFFELIASFKRLREFSGGDVNMVRVACETSEHLDFVVGDDNVERLRLRDGWHNFTLPVDQRDNEARSPGPQSYMYRSRHSRHLYPTGMIAPGYQTTSPTMYPSAGFPPNGMDQAFAGYPDGGVYHPGMNGGDVNGQAYPVESQLSADVPAFAPGGLQGGNDGTLRLANATTMNDDQVANLMLVSHANAAATSSAPNGTHDTSAAGSTQGAPEGAARVNGNAAGSEHGSASVTSPQTSSLQVTGMSDTMESAVPGESVQENYTSIRARALDHRQRASPGELPADMKELYRFWGFFLLDNFNFTVYQDFRALALEDASAKIPLTYGLDKLVRYYEDVLVRGKGRVWGARDIYPEEFNAHYDEAKTIASRNGNTNGEVQA